MSEKKLSSVMRNEKDTTTKIASIHVAAKSALYFAATLFTLFILLSNSLTAVFKSVWRDVGNNWEVAWAFLSELMPPGPLFVLGGTMLFSVLYWLYGGLLLYFDLTPGPHLLSRYKIQPGKNEPVDRQVLMEACKLVLFNQYVVGIPFLLLCYPAFVWRGMSTTLPLPSFERFIMEVICFILVEEVLFYYSHRLLHWKVLYGRIHKIHHQWTAPIGITAIYCHPIEHIFSNLVPLVAGPLLMGSHLAVMWVWILLALINTLNVHSGYHLPFMPSPESHDFHHLRFNENFGVLGLLDYIHGTDVEFRKSLQYQEHRTYFSLDEFPDKHTPPLVPDAKRSRRKLKEEAS